MLYEAMGNYGGILGATPMGFHRGAVGSYGEVWENIGRHGELWGAIGSYGGYGELCKWVSLQVGEWVGP